MRSRVISCDRELQVAIESYKLRSRVISCDRELQVAIESYKLRSRFICRDRELSVAIENNSKTKKESYTHLLNRQSKIFGVPMKNIEMSLTGHRIYPYGKDTNIFLQLALSSVSRVHKNVKRFTFFVTSIETETDSYLYLSVGDDTRKRRAAGWRSLQVPFLFARFLQLFIRDH